MPDLPHPLSAFLAKHERCHELPAGCEDLPRGSYRVWLTGGCGARTLGVHPSAVRRALLA